jgi:hypothetical protein
MTASPDEAFLASSATLDWESSTVGARAREGSAGQVSIAVHVSSQRLVLCDSE